MTATTATRTPRTTKATTGGKAFTKPTGAPCSMDDLVADVDGQPITRSERIVAAIRAGSYVETAAAAAGVPKVTFYEWLKHGARANVKASEGRRLTAKERRYSAFANAVAQAEADAEVEGVDLLAKLARGGYVVTTTTTRTGGPKDADDVVTVREETIGPNAAAVTWRLERRHPDRWGRRQAIEVGGIGDAGVGKVASPLALLLGELDAMDRRQHEALSGVGAVEEGLQHGEAPDPEG